MGSRQQHLQSVQLELCSGGAVSTPEKIPEPKQQETLCSRNTHARVRRHTRTLRQSRKLTHRDCNNRKGPKLLRQRGGWDRTKSPTSDWGQGGRLTIQHHILELERDKKSNQFICAKIKKKTVQRSAGFNMIRDQIKLLRLYLELAIKRCFTLTIWPGGYIYRLLMDGLDSCIAMTAFTSTLVSWVWSYSECIVHF